MDSGLGTYIIVSQNQYIEVGKVSTISYVKEYNQKHELGIKLMLSFDTEVCGQRRWSIYSRQARNTKKAIFVQQII